MAKNIEVSAEGFNLMVDMVHEIKTSIKQRDAASLNSLIMDPTEAAAYLKVSTKFLQQLRDAREIQYVQRGNLVRYRKSDLDQWLSKFNIPSQK